MFRLLKIRTSIDIFRNEKYKVTFGPKYIYYLKPITVFLMNHSRRSFVVMMVSTYNRKHNASSPMLLDPTRTSLLNEPRSEKTGLRGLRQGPTQTGLYNHTRGLEA